MNQHTDIEKLLLFILQQESVKISREQGKLVLKDTNLHIEVEQINSIAQMCSICFYQIDKRKDETPRPIPQSIFCESLDNLCNFLQAFHEKIQKNIFAHAGSPYIEENGFTLRANFLADVDAIKEDASALLDQEGLFKGQTPQGMPYTVRFLFNQNSNAFGVLRFKYKEENQKPNRDDHETFFIFNQQEAREHPLLIHMATHFFKNNMEDKLRDLSHPLINYFFLQEQMQSLCPGSKKPKI